MKSFHSYITEDVATATSTQTQLPELYLDMDETIVDWMSGANAALKAAGKPEWYDPYWKENHSDDEAEKIKWDILNKTPNFWEDLEFTKDGLMIWKFVKKYKPHILSACGTLTKTCKAGKKRWLAKRLGMKNIGNVHLVRRSQKKMYAKDENDKPTVLIDDYIKNCQEYKSAGGIAIQVTTANAVISKLRKLGFK